VNLQDVAGLVLVLALALQPEEVHTLHPPSPGEPAGRGRPGAAPGAGHPATEQESFSCAWNN